VHSPVQIDRAIDAMSAIGVDLGVISAAPAKVYAAAP
jgi:hypothetical protein